MISMDLIHSLEMRLPPPLLRLGHRGIDLTRKPQRGPIKLSTKGSKLILIPSSKALPLLLRFFRGLLDLENRVFARFFQTEFQLFLFFYLRGLTRFLFSLGTTQRGLGLGLC